MAKVAKAIFEAEYGPDQHPAPGEDAIMQMLARAAISAMRNPTEEMLAAITNRVMENVKIERSAPIPWDEGYRLMIEAALEEK